MLGLGTCVFTLSCIYTWVVKRLLKRYMRTYDFKETGVQIFAFYKLSLQQLMCVRRQGHHVLLVLPYHLFHSHPTSTSQKKDILPTHSEFYVLLLQTVIASGDSNKGTDGLEIRLATAVTTSGPRSVHSMWTYFSARRSWLQEQNTSSEEAEISGLECHHLWRYHWLETKISNPKFRTVQEETRSDILITNHFSITEENDSGSGDFWFVLFFLSFCDWFLDH